MKYFLFKLFSLIIIAIILGSMITSLAEAEKIKVCNDYAMIIIIYKHIYLIYILFRKRRIIVQY